MLVSILFAALSSAIAMIFSAEKNTKIAAITSFISAIVNIVLNIVLIPSIGVIGAAIATAISSFTVWFIRWFYCKKYIKLKITMKDIGSYAFVLLQAISFMFMSVTPLYIVQIISVIIILILNIQSSKNIVNNLINRKKTI